MSNFDIALGSFWSHLLHTQRNYPTPHMVVALPLVLILGMSRIARSRHFVTDVVCGMLLGFATAAVVVALTPIDRIHNEVVAWRMPRS